MTPFESDGSDAGPRIPAASSFNVEELRRRNPVALSMDVLFLLSTAFFVILFVKGFWPAVIAGVPLAAMLYFGWKSSAAFFIAQAVFIVGALVVWRTGMAPF